MKAVILSIRPEYIEKIFTGLKKYEFRKHLAKENVDIIFLYCTAPVSKIVGTAVIEERLSSAPSTLWEQTKEFAGITRAKYREYFFGYKKAYAYKLGKVERFKTEKTLEEIKLSTAPQSFVYVKEDLIYKLLDK